MTSEYANSQCDIRAVPRPTLRFMASGNHGYLDAGGVWPIAVCGGTSAQPGDAGLWRGQSG